jgi:hypothetical protein
LYLEGTKPNDLIAGVRLGVCLSDCVRDPVVSRRMIWFHLRLGSEGETSPHVFGVFLSSFYVLCSVSCVLLVVLTSLLKRILFHLLLLCSGQYQTVLHKFYLFCFADMYVCVPDLLYVYLSNVLQFCFIFLFVVFLIILLAPGILYVCLYVYFMGMCRLGYIK